VFINVFSSVVGAVFSFDEHSVIRDTHALYLQAIKPSLDIYSRGYVRELVALLDQLIACMSDYKAGEIDFECCRTVEEEHRMVTERLLHGSCLLKTLKSPRIVARAIVYAFMNFEREMSLEDASCELDVNKIYLSRVFHAHTHMTFVNFLETMRMRLAGHMLRNSAMRVSEVSGRVGYNDAHYFSRLFKKHSGQTPEEYRKAAVELEVKM
jgi:YesN/AraC family two-component response regulator